MHSNGIVCLARQVFSVGRHRAGTVVRIRIEERVLHVTDLDGQLIKSLPRTGKKVVVETEARRIKSNKPR